MNTALFVARLLLAAVFTTAGLGKLFDREGSRRAITDFGLPRALAPTLAILLPLAELAVAGALIPTSSARWGAMGALTLLGVFMLGIGINLARGRQPDCHCFGQIHSAPAGWPTLARNAVLAAVAGFVVWQGWEHPGPSAVTWLDDLTTSARVGAILGALGLGLVVLEGAVLVGLLRQNGRLLLRVEDLEQRLSSGELAPGDGQTAADSGPGLPVGSPAPAFTLSGIHGEILTLDFLRARGKPVMLIFSRPGCGPCESLLPEVEAWQRDHGGSLTVALVSEGTLESNREKFGAHSVSQVLVQKGLEVSEAYQVSGTPSAVIVSPDGTIGSSLVAGPDQIRNLVQRTVGTPSLLPMAAPTPTAAPSNGNGNAPAPVAAMPQGPRIGEPAPALKLPDLDGKTLDLARFRGSKTLVVFWNPDCGFCSQMLDDLKAWEKQRPKKAPKLLIVSQGSAEVNRAMGLRSPVVLDNGPTAMFEFGANGTPMAVLVDENGNIASEVAAGAEAVLALARGGGAQRATA